MSALGYDRVHVPRGGGLNFTEEEIRCFDAKNLRLKEDAPDHTRISTLKRRDWRAALILEIRDLGQMSPPSMRAIA